jgi:hypothetical protein
MRWISTVVVATWMTACSQGNVSFTRLEPGPECPTGGVRLTTGSSSELVCNGTVGANGSNGTSGMDGRDGSGTSGATSLVRQVRLPVGDSRCPFGGVLVSVGLDSGADGGVAGDGMLQASEVTSEEVVCGGGDGQVGSLTPPPGLPGTGVIRARGGSGLERGGAGGAIDLEMATSGGGHLKVWRTGRADASFIAPPAPPFSPGPDSLSVTGNVVVALVPLPADGASLPASSPFVSADDDRLYLSRGPAAPPQRVNSLRVEAGARLTLPSTGVDGVTVDGRCSIDGTVTVSGNDDPLELKLSCSELFLNVGSVVDGVTPTTSVNVDLRATRVLVARGRIEASASSFRRSGDVSVRATQLWNQGAIRAMGANSTSGNAVSPGRVSLFASEVLFNSGSIDVSAGAFSPTNPGSVGARGGTITFVSAQGTVRNQGALAANGSSLAGTSCNSCTAGGGGELRFQADEIVNDAALSATGGAGAGGEGGQGGLVDIRTSRTAMGLSLSGSIDVSGGNGDRRGGGGGNVFLVRPKAIAGAFTGAEVVLLGYQQIDARGGDGRSGGTGGAVRLRIVGSEGDPRGGAVAATADFDVRGGDSMGSSNPESGGHGGRVTLQTEYAPIRTGAPWETATVTGAILASGGTGPIGGSGGDVTVEGFSGSSLAEVTATGGAGTMGRSGLGGFLSASASDGVVSSRAVVDVSSGAAAVLTDSSQGTGGEVLLRGKLVQVTGAISARGASLMAGPGLSGGGGLITLESTRGQTTVAVPAPGGLDVSPGAGPTRGGSGAVVIDQIDVTSAWSF